MSAIASQFALGVAQAMTQLGVQSTYRRADTGATLTGLTVILHQPEFQVDATTTALMLSANRWDALVITTDLTFSGSTYEPKPGDTITVGSTTYLVTIDDAQRYCWTWADKHQIRRKICLKTTVG